MSEALAKIEAPPMALERPHPREVIKAATEEANVLAEVIDSRKLYSVIQGKKFVKVEGWVTLATLRGCLPREVAVHEMEEGRYVAEVELIRMSDGMVLTRASAECGGDGDNTWKARPANARRSMAITRATGKACRVAFSWVMALAGYEVTPAEEMDHIGASQQEPLRTDPAPREAPHPPACPTCGLPVEARPDLGDNEECVCDAAPVAEDGERHHPDCPVALNAACIAPSQLWPTCRCFLLYRADKGATR